MRTPIRISTSEIPAPLVEYNIDKSRKDKWLEVKAGNIDNAEELDTADPEELLKKELEIERENARSIMISGYILRKFWLTGVFMDMDDGYPWTMEGYLRFLHHNGSHLSPAEISARQKVWETFVPFSKETHRKVEAIGVSKARAAANYVTSENVEQVLDCCYTTPYFHLRNELERQFGARPTRGRRDPEARRREDHQRVLKILSSTERVVGGMFIPRSKPLPPAQEYKARRIWMEAMDKTNYRDPDEFFMAVLDLVANRWLNETEIRVIENAALTFAPKE